MALRTASIALAFFIVPSVAWAASDDPCRTAEDGPPTLHWTNEPLVRDGWIVLDPGYDPGSITDVRLRDGSGREIAATAVFDSSTARMHEIFEPAEVLEAGDYALVFTYVPKCFEPREVTIPVEVVDRFAEPVAAPVITKLDVELWNGSLLIIDVEVEELTEDDPPAWVVVDTDFPDPRWTIDTLLAPLGQPLAEFDRLVEEEVTKVCARATSFDLSGAPSSTTELCTTDIELRENEPGGPLSCSMGGRTSVSWALGLLLGLALVRRRRACARTT